MLLPDHFVLPLNVRNTKAKANVVKLNAIPIFSKPENYFSGKFYLK